MSLDYPFASSPIPGETEEIIPGVFWLRMPLPFSLNHINLWLIAEDGGYAIVDTGLGDDLTLDLWLKILGSRRLTRVLVTHHHSDHMGSAAWLSERYDARMWTTHTEWLIGRNMSLVGDTETTAIATSFYAAAGLADDMLTALPARLNLYSRATRPVTPIFRRLRHGDEIVLGGRRWRVIVGEGHT
jgi:glyoxylase-like metal-dependent hydrolase (beta-lactamase superfamily II)